MPDTPRPKGESQSDEPAPLELNTETLQDLESTGDVQGGIDVQQQDGMGQVVYTGNCQVVQTAFGCPATPPSVACSLGCNKPR